MPYDTLVSIEAKRGLVPRSAYIVDLIGRALNGSATAERVQNVRVVPHRHVQSDRPIGKKAYFAEATKRKEAEYYQLYRCVECDDEIVIQYWPEEDS